MGHVLTRREAREAVFMLLFETEFHGEDTPQEILNVAREERELGDNSYIEDTYLGVVRYSQAMDALINRFSNGWKADRLSRVSRAAIRLCVYEMLFCQDIPETVSLNEAIELTKKYDDPKARAFVNGVLNRIKDEIDEQGTEAMIRSFALNDSDRDNVPVEAGIADVTETVCTENEKQAPLGEVEADTPASDRNDAGETD